MSDRPDLSTLRRDPAAAVPEPRRSAASRVLIPGGILVAFVALLLWAGRDALTPAISVRVVPVVVKSGAGGSAGSAVARAAGWIEPDPFEVHVPALVDGVITEILVLDGDHVEAGQVVARMVDDLARIEATLAAESLRAARADAELARANRDGFRAVQGIELESSEDVAIAILSEAESEREAALRDEAGAVASAEAAAERARRAESERAAGTATRSVAAEAKSAALAATEAAAAASARRVAAERRVDEARRRSEAAKAYRKAGTRDGRSVAAADAEVARAEADVARAEASLAVAKLALDRHSVRAPAAGCVLARLAAPGSRLSASSAHGTDVLTLYDPSKLQVRVDVPLADAGKVGAGQKARVTVEALPGRSFEGEVTRVVPQADVAKNTVQAKVRIAAPDPGMKPEMLARVEFVGREGATAPGATRSVFAPERLLRREGAGDRAVAWIVADGRAARRDVRLGGGREGDLVEVVEGLLPGDDVIDADPSLLAEGTKVRIEGGSR